MSWGANFRKDITIPDGFSFPAFEWNRYRELIAADPPLYDTVERAYTTAHRVNQTFRGRRSVSTSRLIGVNTEDGLEEVDQAARNAILALENVIAPADPLTPRR